MVGDIVPSQRTALLSSEAAFAVAARARALAAAGRDVIDLGIGEPGIPTPAHIVEAGRRALADGHTGYAPPEGLAALREAIANDFTARGVAADPDRVVVTPGAKLALFNAALALLGPGDDALVPDPGFPIYPSLVRAAGARPVPYALEVGAIAATLTPRTRVLFLNAPGNPTGHAWSSAELDGIAELVLAHGLAVVSDEVYGRLRFEGRHESLAERPAVAHRVVLVDGASKAWAMTGWRLGWMLAPAPMVEPLTRFVVNTVSCTAAFVQLAGVAALTGPQECVGALVRDLRRRRDAFVAGLRRLPGVSCRLPAGALYAFPRLGGEPPRLADRLLEGEGVATLDGAGFGARGAGHLRVSLAVPDERLQEALARLGRCLAHRAVA